MERPTNLFKSKQLSPFKGQKVGSSIQAAFKAIFHRGQSVFNHKIYRLSTSQHHTSFAALELLNNELGQYGLPLEEYHEDLIATGRKPLRVICMEKTWRNSKLKSDLEAAGVLREEGKFAAAVQVLECTVEWIHNSPRPPNGMDWSQHLLIVLTNLFRSYELLSDHHRMAECATQLNTLLSDLFGQDSQTRCMLGFKYAMAIQNLDNTNTVAKDILVSITETLKLCKRDDSVTAGLVYSQLGRCLLSTESQAGQAYLLQGINVLKMYSGCTGLLKNLADGLISSFWELGQFEEAKSVSSAMAYICTTQLGLEHIDTCTFLVDLGYTNLELRQLSEAESVLRKAIMVLEKIAEPDQDDMLRAMSNLASVMGLQGSLEESIRMNRRVTELRERKYGPSAPVTLRSMANLGVELAQYGAFREAKVTMKEVQDRIEKEEELGLYEEIYIQVKTSLANLSMANPEDEMKEKEDTTTVILQAEDEIKSLLCQTPTFLSQKISQQIDYLITLYERENRVEDIYQLLRMVIDSCCSSDPSQPNSLRFRRKLAAILTKLPDRKEEAVENCQRGLAACEAADPESVNAASWELSLGSALLMAGREEDGVNVLRKALSDSIRLEGVLGSGHRFALISLFQNATKNLPPNPEDMNFCAEEVAFWEDLINIVQLEH